jgi:thiamine transport system ATP-binding protein
LSALDRGLRERLAIDVRNVLRETRTTAVFVTHDHDEAFTVADRVAVMLRDPGTGGGRLVQVAPPEELWRAPVSQRVAEFLGYQAFVPASGLGDDGAWTAVGPAGLRIVQGAAEGADVWDAVVVGSVFRRGRTEVTVEADLGTGVQQVAALAGRGLTDVPVPGEKVVVALDPSGCAVVPR